MKTNPVRWFELYVQDMERAKKFYEQTFGTSFQKLDSPGVEIWAFPMEQEGSGCAGALVRMEGKDSGVGGTIVYFPGEDCAALAEKAVQHGGQLQCEKKSIGTYGFIAHVLDTEGNLIGLHSMR